MLVLTLLYAGMNHYLLTTALADLGPNDHEMRTALHKELGSIHWASKGFISFVALGIPYLFTVYILRFAMHCLIAPNAAAQTEHEV